MNTSRTDRDYKSQRTELRRILKDESTSIHDYRRLICVQSMFTTKDVKRMSAKQIAYLIMMKPQSVRNIQHIYKKKGLKSIINRDGRGGRRRSNLSFRREQTLLRNSCTFDKPYGRHVIMVNRLKTHYRKTARTYPLNSTVYRLMERHGCHRISCGIYSTPSI